MSATAYARGHKIFYNGTEWRYEDNGEIIDHNRPCARCGKKPTPEGYDACIGHVKGAKSVCCGHGKSKSLVVMDGEAIQHKSKQID